MSDPEKDGSSFADHPMERLTELTPRELAGVEAQHEARAQGATDGRPRGP